MSPAPLLDAGNVLLVAEVLSVLRFAQPPALPPGLAGPFALGGRAVLLTIMGAGVGQEELLAMQALAFPTAAPWFHRQVLSKTADAGRRRPPTKTKPALSQDGSKKTKKMVVRGSWSKKIEEKKTGFQTAATARFSFRRCHRPRRRIFAVSRPGGLLERNHLVCEMRYLLGRRGSIEEKSACTPQRPGHRQGPRPGSIRES